MPREMYDLVLADGLIVGSAGTFPGTIAVRGGKIAGMWHESDVPDLASTATVDCRGAVVMPGGVDPHVHVGISFGDVETAESYSECTAAAVAGGTTTIVDFAIPRVGQSPLGAIEERLAALSGRCYSDVAIHGCFTDRTAQHVDQIADMVSLGVTTVKVYTTYRNQLMASNDLIRAIMSALLPHRGLTYVHAEDNSMIEAAMNGHPSGEAMPFSLISAMRSESAEDTAVRHVLAMAEELGAPVYFVHQSTATAIDLVRSARSRGVRAFSEVCPHYILLDESSYAGVSGACYTCCPPLRSRATVDELMARVVEGGVAAIASDHCCFRTEHKAPFAGELRSMPFGMPGVQTRVPIALSELVCRRGMPIADVVDLLCTRPAAHAGLFPRKGVLQVGSDADVLVWSPEGTTVLRSSDLLQASDYTPFEGWQVLGKILHVFLGGVRVAGDGAVPVRIGRYVPSAA